MEAYIKRRERERLYLSVGLLLEVSDDLVVTLRKERGQGRKNMSGLYYKN